MTMAVEEENTSGGSADRVGPKAIETLEMVCVDGESLVSAGEGKGKKQSRSRTRGEKEDYE